jgi:antitoxin component YwqK of YwqJK toxin-antitoxin module
MLKYKKVPNNDDAIEIDGKVVLSFDPKYKEYLRWREENPDLERELIDDLQLTEINKLLCSGGKPNIKEFGNGLFRYEWFFENGQKRFESEVKDDIFNGKSASWNESGEKLHEGEFKNGKRFGEWIFYNGEIITKHIYQDKGNEQLLDDNRGNFPEERDGLVKIIKVNDPSTSTRENTKKIIYWKSGVKKNELGLMGGTSLSYHNIKSKNGNCVYYWKNGNKMCEGQYVLNEIHGTWTWYYDTGQVKNIINYISGIKDGEFKIFYKNGNIKVKGKYKDNDRQGIWLINGVKRKYKNGKEL